MLQLEPAGQSSVPYFSNDTAPTGNYTLSLHDALPISEAGGPAVAVAENVAGETLVPASEAWTSCACPGVVPSVQWIVVRPEPSVGPLGFERLPPPSVTANVTVTPAIGLLPASTTSSASADGRVARTTPVCPSPPALMSWAAACATDTVTWALNPPVVAIACALPLPTAVTRPDADTVATPPLSEDQP